MNVRSIWFLRAAVCTCCILAAGFWGTTARGEEAGDADTFQTIYDSIPLEEVEEALQEMKEEEIDFSIQDYVEQVMKGDGELSLKGIGGYVRSYLVHQFEKNKNTFIKLILYGVLSGVFLNFSSSMYEKQMGDTGFQIIYFLSVSVMAGGFFSSFSVASDVLADIVHFMSVLVPSFSIALTWSSGSAASMAFYQAALSAIAVAENVLVKIFLPIVQVYFLICILNPLTEWKFTRFASLLRGFVRFGTKAVLAVMIGHQGIQGLIMPALDSVKRSAVFKTASSMPGVGNLFGSVTDTVIGTGVLIKSAIGVGGLAAVCIICVVPIMKLAVFTVVYKGLAAFSQPVTDKRIVSVFQSTADSGRLLLHIVFMTAVMFLITLTIVIAATNPGGG
ncbi:MAG: stage III sporulation protein AE [Roseburia sp.]|nr:stage III sporulation protein AE [Roseburia sp.]